MDFSLNDEQRIIQETIRDFVSKECPREVARELDESKSFPEDLLNKIAELGFCGLTVPEEYGGEGVNLLGATIAVEELSVLSPVLALAYMYPTFGGGAVLSRLGSKDQKEHFLGSLARGSLLFTIGLAETEAGYSSTQLIKTKAVTEKDGFRINGKKLFVSLADRAQYCLTLVRTEKPDSEQEELTFFIIDLKSPGVHIKDMHKMGMKGVNPKEVEFKDVRISADNTLGGRENLHNGLKQLEDVLDLQNLGTAACCLGIAQGVYDYARKHARERIQFDYPIISFEAIQYMLVDLAVQIDAMRLLLYRAVVCADQGNPFSREINTAMVYGLDLVHKASMQAMQICGGYGYALEYDAQRYFRDAYSVPLNGQTNKMIHERVAVLTDL